MPVVIRGAGVGLEAWLSDISPAADLCGVTQPGSGRNCGVIAKPPYSRGATFECISLREMAREGGSSRVLVRPSRTIVIVRALIGNQSTWLKTATNILIMLLYREECCRTAEGKIHSLFVSPHPDGTRHVARWSPSKKLIALYHIAEKYSRGNRAQR